MNNDCLKYWLSYSRIQKIGPINFKKLADSFINMEIAWKASAGELRRIGIKEDLASEITIRRTQINPDEELENLARENVKVVTIIDDNYPKPLKEIYNPPPVLYYRGSLDFLDSICVAMIGTRNFSTYGRRVAEELAGELARNGVTIISGLALGIDSISHRACLNRNGKTMAVLGSGVDKQCVFPSSNRYIADKILESGGALISEYPVGTTPTKFTFPMRNRIVSGLSKMVLVIEAPENSGTLITVKHALEQNRDVLAVPGSIYSENSQGTNRLIKQGAKAVTCAKDVLEELNIQTEFKMSEKHKGLDKDK